MLTVFELHGMFSKTMNLELKCVWVPKPIIIGAGPSGLATAACLEQKGVPFLILERENCLASLWRQKTYDCLKLHLPKQFCELPHMPFPREFPAYPTRQQFISYLEAYAKRFSIKPMFEEEVRWVKYDANMGVWRVRANKFEFVCHWLVVATGENAIPAVPDIAGLQDFSGRLLHSSEYKNGADFRGSKVLVVGCGNSGMEVSLDLCNSGAQVSLVVRDKLHILPRAVLGISIFALSTWMIKWFPIRLVDQFVVLSSRMILGDTRRYGIRRPEIGPFELKKAIGKTPVLDVGAITKIKSGEIKVVGGIQRLTTSGANFLDGKAEEFESIILATGYKTNVASWLKEANFFSHSDGHPKNLFPNGWKGNNGVYSVGFTRQGLSGASTEARRVAEDIARQWYSQTKHLHLEYMDVWS